MLFSRPNIRIETERMILRLPKLSDYAGWRNVRQNGAAFLAPWEPNRGPDHLSKQSFRQRVYWSSRSTRDGRSLPLFLFTHQGQFLGAATLDNIRRGPAQMANLGYWIGEEYARKGYMSEAVRAIVDYGFTELDLSRIEAACLPKNAASRGLLETCGFKYEGVAQAYLQIAGRWRTHVLYANLRSDRRGRSDAE
jgi:ribosomal-protein-alanine N-acetyltransferase